LFYIFLFYFHPYGSARRETRMETAINSNKIDMPAKTAHMQKENYKVSLTIIDSQ